MMDGKYGLTAQQILAAPLRSLYIVASADLLGYTKDLAKHLGRGDLTFAVPGYLGRSPSSQRKFPKIIIDHAVWDSLGALDRRTASGFQRAVRMLQGIGLIDAQGEPASGALVSRDAPVSG